MSQTVPDFTTAIVTILFLSVLAIVAYVIKIKSGSLKKLKNNLVCENSKCKTKFAVVNKIPWRLDNSTDYLKILAK